MLPYHSPTPNWIASFWGFGTKSNYTLTKQVPPCNERSTAGWRDRCCGRLKPQSDSLRLAYPRTAPTAKPRTITDFCQNLFDFRPPKCLIGMDTSAERGPCELGTFARNSGQRVHQE